MFRKEKSVMKKWGNQCLDCGSHVVERQEDNHLPQFKMECITYACGATLKTAYSSNGNTGKAIHSGCGLLEEQVSPL